jgi:hypothetical protein
VDLRHALAVALLAVPGSAAAQVDAGDAQEIVEALLGFDASRHASPLEAMQGWGELYARYRDAAAGGDDAALRVWLLVGHAALVTADAAMMEAFASDMMPVYRGRPEAVLAAMAAAGWLVPSACFHLGSWFEHEERGGEGRAAFLAAETTRIEAALHADRARACLAQIEAPDRPE